MPAVFGAEVLREGLRIRLSTVSRGDCATARSGCHGQVLTRTTQALSRDGLALNEGSSSVPTRPPNTMRGEEPNEDNDV